MIPSSSAREMRGAVLRRDFQIQCQHPHTQALALIHDNRLSGTSSLSGQSKSVCSLGHKTMRRARSTYVPQFPLKRNEDTRDVSFPAISVWTNSTATLPIYSQGRAGGPQLRGLQGIFDCMAGGHLPSVPESSVSTISSSTE